ncbi:acyl-CoA dehydrogenase [Nocardia sp. NPDC127579]|uniref:acyl-CoA dehydrogenase n=1 Tax=Nocardia sp. NPDC127579 TaxID=3345402 RepID=UPI00362EF36E
MSHFKTNLRDLEFNLFDVLGIGDLLDAGAYGSMDRATALYILQEAMALAEGPVAASYVAADRDPVQFDQLNGVVVVPDPLRKSVTALQDGGWTALGMPPGMGGMVAPAPLHWAVQEMLMAANRNAHFFNLGPMLHTVLYLEGSAIQRRWAQHSWESRWGATMVLTEPEAGSDVGLCRTEAVAQADGTWHLRGVKRFISGGDLGETADNIMHLVLARPAGAKAGTKGLSLFVVPKFLFHPHTMDITFRNGVRVTGVEHKMGIRSAPTCELTFGAEQPAVGYLVGDTHNGIAQMFRAIQAARMSVGAMATGTLSSGYLHALEYAKSRTQGPDMRFITDKAAPRVTIAHHPSVRRGLMLQKAYAEGLRALYLYCAAYQDPVLALRRFGVEAALAERVSELLLPIVKGVASERAYEMLGHSMQVLGGSGYLTDYPLEQYVRDTRVDSMYEGTTAIQAQDFFFRKLMRDGGEALRHVTGLVGRFAYTDRAGGRLRAEQQLLGTALVEFTAMTTALSKYLLESVNADQDIYKVGLALEPFLFATGDLIIGWRLLEQAEIALAASERTSPADKEHFYQGKVAVARWFAKNRLPLLGAVRQIIETADTDIMRLSESAF